MAGFQHLVKSQKNGAADDLEMLDAETGAITTPGTALSNALRLRREAQGIHANADGTMTVEDTEGNVVPIVVKAGGYYPYRIVRVFATDTTLTAAEFNLLYDPY